jgi:hypothetical protein
MGSGGSIPRTEYQRERAKPLDCSDFGDDVDLLQIREELQRIRQLLHKYADETTADIHLNDIVGNSKEQRHQCISHILHFRKMLRQPSLQQSRRVKDQRRRLSLQGQNLARMALMAGVKIGSEDSDSGSDDGLEDMPRK